METVGLVLFGVAVGLVSGMLGIGGGIVLVPGLVFLFGFTQTEAQGTSLAVLSVPVAIFAAFVYYQNGFVRIPAVTAIVAGFAVGAYFGARLIPHAPTSVLRVGFGGILLYVGFLYVFDVRQSRALAALPAGIATLVVLIVARLLRRKLPKRPPPPGPSAGVEYHI